MIPIRLEIQDFLSYRGHHELDFVGIHVTSIVGPNGSGKSALLDAISWVLFGRSREHSIVGRKTNKQRDSVINDSAEFCEVSLEFEVEGNRFLVNRAIDRGKGGWRIQFKRLTASGEENIREKGKIEPIIEHELGVTYDVFFSSSFITQGDSSRFMGASVAKRLELLSDILDLSAYDKCLTETKNQAKDVDGKYRLLESKAEELREESSNIEELERELDRATSERKKLDEQLSELSKKVETTNNQLLHLGHTLDEIAQKKEKQMRLSSELTELKTTAEKISAVIKTHNTILSDADIIEKGYADYQRIRVSLDELNEKKRKHEDIRHKIDTLNTRIQVEEGKLKARLESLQSRSDELNAYVSDNRDAPDRLRDIASRRDTLKGIRTKLDEINSKTKETETRIESARDTRTDLTSQIDQLLVDADLSDIDKAKETLDYIENTLIDELNQIKAELNSSKSSIADNQNQLSSLSTAIEHIKEELKLLNSKEGGRCPLCSSELSDDSALQLIDDKQRQLDVSVSQRHTLKKSSVELKKHEQLTSERMKELESTKHKKSILKQIVSLESRIIEIESSIAKSDEELNKLHTEAQAINDDNKELLGCSDRLETDYVNLSSILNTLAEKKVELETVCAKLEHTKLSINSRSFCVSERDEVNRLTEELEKVDFDTAIFQEVSNDEKRLRSYVDKKNELDLSRERLESAEKELGRNIERQEQIEKEVSALTEITKDEPQIRASLEESRTAFDKLTSERNSVSANRDEAIRVVQSKSTTVISAREASEKLKEVSSQLQTLEIEAEMLGRLKVMFGREGIPSQILEGVVPQLEDVANDILERISKGRHHGEAMRMRFELTRESVSGKRNTALDIILSDGENERPYELFSGGERFRADFAIRLALSHILARRSGRRLRMLVIDEGFGTQDDEGVSALIDAIHDVSADFEKVLVVSHVDEIKNQFDRQISVWKDGEGSHFRLV